MGGSVEKVFVVSDIHGMYTQLKELLNHWNKEDKLVILGDLVDRGECSADVLTYIHSLKKQGHDVTLIRGNHEELFLDFLNAETEDVGYYANCGGLETIHSFREKANIEGRAIKEIKEYIRLAFKEEVDMITNALLYYQYGKLLFTHAGFNSIRADWKDTTEEEFSWIRNHYKHRNKTGYINVFGHTPTRTMYEDLSNDIWVSSCGTYIGIDGGCAYGGQLNGVLFSADGKILETYKVK